MWDQHGRPVVGDELHSRAALQEAHRRGFVDELDYELEASNAEEFVSSIADSPLAGVVTAPTVDRKLYCEMPQGFVGPDNTIDWVLLMLMALEGIKQGGYLWFQHNKRAWMSKKIGLVSWFGEPNL